MRSFEPLRSKILHTGTRNAGASYKISGDQNMAKKAVKELKAVADPTIEDVAARFLKGRVSVTEVSKSDRKGALELFMGCMNGYAYQSLSKDESTLFEHYYDLEGKAHKEFCQIFGPEKIPENVGEFVGYYLIRKVMLPGDEMGMAAKAVSEFCTWLANENIVPAEAANQAAALAASAAKVLPCAEDANRLIWQVAQKCPKSVQQVIEFGETTVKKIDKDCLWLESHEGSDIGPVVLQKEALMLLKAGWTINCALVKSAGKWHFCEVGNVYPVLED